MQHYTIDTGHCRLSPRAEVSDEAIEALMPLLRPGDHRMPEPFERYSLRVTIDGLTLAASVFAGPAPLVTTMVALDDAGLAAAIKATSAIPAVQLKLPCIIVQTYPTLTLDHEAIGWLGDFERCLGWTWVERNRRM